jgi:type II secretory pathway component PulK
MHYGNHERGYVLPSALTLLLLIALATASGINIASTHIRLLQSEIQYQKAFELAEMQLVEAEQTLSKGIAPAPNEAIEVNLFRPKNFRVTFGVATQHYKIKSKITHRQTKVSIESTIRIDEKIISTKNKKAMHRSMQRINWTVL